LEDIRGIRAGRTPTHSIEYLDLPHTTVHFRSEFKTRRKEHDVFPVQMREQRSLIRSFMNQHADACGNANSFAVKLGQFYRSTKVPAAHSSNEL
jgi:hypothetical protein